MHTDYVDALTNLGRTELAAINFLPLNVVILKILEIFFKNFHRFANYLRSCCKLGFISAAAICPDT